MSLILGMTYGPSKPALRPQLYEVGPPFGPCQDGRSPWCSGVGFQTIDPANLGGEGVSFRLAVLCGACTSKRESDALIAEVWPEENAA